MQAAANPAAIAVDDAALGLTFDTVTFLQSHGDLDGDAVGDLLAHRGYTSDTPYALLSGAALRDGGTFAVESFDAEWTDTALMDFSCWTTSRADGDIDGDGVNEILLGTYVEYAFILRDW